MWPETPWHRFLQFSFWPMDQRRKSYLLSRSCIHIRIPLCAIDLLKSPACSWDMGKLHAEWLGMPSKHEGLVLRLPLLFESPTQHFETLPCNTLLCLKHWNTCTVDSLQSYFRFLTCFYCSFVLIFTFCFFVVVIGADFARPSFSSTEMFALGWMLLK